MRDAEIEGAPYHGTAVLQGVDTSEIVPEAERDRQQQEAASAAALVYHAVVTPVVGCIAHYRLLFTCMGLCTLPEENTQSASRLKRFVSAGR